MKAKKKTKMRSVVIKIRDLPNGRVDTDVTFSPPVSRSEATGAQKWGYEILEEIARMPEARVERVETGAV